MKKRLNRVYYISSCALFVLAVSAGFVPITAAQNQEMQEKVADIKQAVAMNKQALAQFTWVEQVTISLKGEQKKEEYKEYADNIKALIQQYVPPDKDLIEQARQKGNIMLGPAAGAPGEYRLVLSNYIKQGDNMTLVIDKAQKDLASLSISTYLSDPSDAVNVTVQFSRIPGGPNHVSAQTINGVSKQLTINVQNSNYQHM